MSKLIAKYDLYTHEPIEYKSKGSYATNLYNNRTNLIKHFKEISPEKSYEIAKKIVKLRKDYKNLKYALSQVELRSIIAPSILLLQKKNVDYNRINSELGLEQKYTYNDSLINFESDKKLKGIIVDTREQRPLKFNTLNVVAKCLPYGDYANFDDPNCSIVVERKSLNDLVGTISAGYNRFVNELTRAQDKNAYIVMIVENNFSDSLCFNYLPFMRYAKSTPSFIFSRLRNLIQVFPNFQPVFVSGRTESSILTEIVLSLGKDYVQEYDLQYCVDKKLIGFERTGKDED